MRYETEAWPFIGARWFTKTHGVRRSVRLVVIHDMEAPESEKTAENVAHYFLTTDTKASAHINIDSTSIVQSVKDNDVAYAAPGANHDGIHIELAGYAKQTRKDWLDDYSIRMLNRAADATAQYCLKYSLAAKKLTDAELLGGSRGIVGHDQVSRVYKRSTHTDPGPNFPWTVFISLVREHYEIRRVAGI